MKKIYHFIKSQIWVILQYFKKNWWKLLFTFPAFVASMIVICNHYYPESPKLELQYNNKPVSGNTDIVLTKDEIWNDHYRRHVITFKVKNVNNLTANIIHLKIYIKADTVLNNLGKEQFNSWHEGKLQINKNSDKKNYYLFESNAFPIPIHPENSDYLNLILDLGIDKYFISDGKTKSKKYKNIPIIIKFYFENYRPQEIKFNIKKYLTNKQ